MTLPHISPVHLGGSPDLPLLVLGPSLGTSAQALWARCATHLAGDFHVIGLDLPGHGTNTQVAEPFTMADLAGGVLAMVRDLGGDSFVYAGDSVGGAIGLQLLLDAPDQIISAILLATGAKIGDAEGWRQRAAAVRASGTPSMVTGSAERWWVNGFLDREPAVGAELLRSLQDAADEGYAQVCEALADFDVRERLGEIQTPVLAVAGAHDVVTTTEGLAAIASGVANGQLVVLHDAAHLPPAESPAAIADLIRDHALGGRGPLTTDEVRAAGMTVRREVLGDAHVDRATAAATDLTAEFQEFITQYAWGTIWTRPGLDRRSRSMITLTALVARGHHKELAMHVRAARTNGLTNDEIKELLLQTAIYCGVPDANTAFGIAQEVLAELDAE